MKFDIGVPSGAIKHYVSWVGEGQLLDFAVSAEMAGFDSVHVTDHPFPEDAWLANGGHHAFDPFVALTSMAAVTRTIRLRTNLLVAGYRSPYLMARSIASLDRLSHGRMIVGMGAGYLEAEFDALGADFAGRGKRFDEAIEAMTAAFTGESVDREGGLYPASGHSMLPTPVQQPRPPLWVGGNSAAAKRRAATLADGWIPMPANPVMAEITGTTTLTTFEQLRDEIADVHGRREEAGRTAEFDIAFGAFGMPGADDDPDGERMREVITEHEDIGVTWMSLPCRGRSLTACQEEIAWLGERVIGPMRATAGGS